MLIVKQAQITPPNGMCKSPQSLRVGIITPRLKLYENTRGSVINSAANIRIIQLSTMRMLAHAA